ncbi:hypothetical protein SRHO_G00163730 [Serrasalmus rhombeus]
MVIDMCPLSMVEDAAFKAMISTFHPNYELPSRTFFTKQMEKKYEGVKAKMKQALQEAESITLTTDIWTSIATEAYMGVTCHYLGKNWKMVSHCLTTMPLEERHTAANIAQWIEEVITKFDIPAEKIKAVVHDNGANVVAASKILQERFRKLRFLPADEVFKVQNAVRAMALAAKQQVRQPTASNHGTSSTEAPAAYAEEATPFFDSDTTTSDEDQDAEKQLNAVEQEVSK